LDLVLNNISLFAGENLDYIENGYIVIKNGIIEKVGTGKYIEGSNKNTFESRNILVIPGFINAHTHIGDSIGKDIGAESTFESRIHPVHGIKSKILKRSERKHLVTFMRSSVISMMKKGVVAFADFRESGLQGIEQITEATTGLSIRSIILGRPEHYYDISRDFNKNPKIPKDLTESVNSILDTCDGLGISGANENTDNSLNEYRNIIQKRSQKKKYLLGIHASESPISEKKSIAVTGKSEVQRIVDNLLPNFVVHLTNASDVDIRLVAQKKIGVVVCPRANASLGVGIPKIAKMLNYGCNVAIGTDNIMINSPDMFRELDYIWKITRAFEKGAISAREILKMATVNGGRILGINSGCLMAGMSADMIFIDKTNLDISLMHDPHVSIVHRASPNSILNVMINGNFVDEDEFGCM
jgi:cytosine/adenosine deaminase-related metal-dependent hydrolase